MNLLPFQVSSKTLLKILEIWQWHQKHWISKANNVYLLKPADQWPQSAITIYLLGFQNKWIMNWKNGKLDICHPFLPVLSFTQFNLILENLKKVGLDSTIVSLSNCSCESSTFSLLRFLQTGSWAVSVKNCNYRQFQRFQIGL